MRIPRPIGMSLVGLLALIVWIDLSGEAKAQGISGRPNAQTASPYNQRLSPYLDLLRSDNSALSPYHAFVRPRQQIQQGFQQQAFQIRKLRGSINNTTAPHAIPDRMQTGRGGGFNNYLHFYQVPRGAISGQNSGPRR
jgi:hypothetical protein